MWFFAILVVLVMGGVAALAAGRGAPMSEAYDDRVDALVPSDRLLAADDIRRVRFTLAFRGYRMTEVDALLDRLARELEEARMPPPAAPRHAAEAGQDEAAETPPVSEARGDEPPR